MNRSLLVLLDWVEVNNPLLEVQNPVIWHHICKLREQLKAGEK